MGKNIKNIVLWTLLIILLVGCGAVDNSNNTKDGEKKDDSGLGKEKVLSIDPEPNPEEDSITLYFKHKYCDYLVPEVRSAVRNKQTWEQLIVEEIIKGSSQHDRISILPEGIKVLDVTRKGDTVFVDLSREFNGDANLSGIPGKEEIPEEKRAQVKADMKRLGIYSIVNSLTELEEVNKVKFLVENRAISYEEIEDGLSNLIPKDFESPDEEQVESTVLMALSRDRSYILTPAKAVEIVFEGLVGEPKWDRVYSLLSKETVGKGSLPSKEELSGLWPVLVNSIELDEDFIVDEEIKSDGKAFVTTSYMVNFASGKKEKKDKDTIIVVNEDNIWRVKLPEFLSEFR